MATLSDAQRAFLTARLGEVVALRRAYDQLRYWRVACADDIAYLDALTDAFRGMLAGTEPLPGKEMLKVVAEQMDGMQGYFMHEWVRAFGAVGTIEPDDAFKESLDTVDAARAAYIAKLRDVTEKRRPWKAVSGGDVSRQ